MMKSAQYVAGALALAVGLGLGVAHAGPEQVITTGEGALAQAFTQVRASIGAKLAKVAKEQKKAPAGLYGRDHCSPYDATMIPAYDSEMGYYCKSRNPASVSCEIVGWQTVNEGEGGPITRPILGNCNPRGGFAGTPLERAPEAP